VDLALVLTLIATPIMARCAFKNRWLAFAVATSVGVGALWTYMCNCPDTDFDVIFPLALAWWGMWLLVLYAICFGIMAFVSVIKRTVAKGWQKRLAGETPGKAPATTGKE